MDITLPSSDYESIIEFASIIAEPNENIRSIILEELAKRFGYTKSIFWVADDEGNLFDPVFYGLNDRAIYSYVDNYYKYDLLHPQRNLPLYQSKKLLRLIDVVMPEEYETSTFYQGFMVPQNTYDEMVITLTHENKLVGVLGLGGIEKNTFTSIDCKRFLMMSELIGTTFIYQYQTDPILLSEREKEVVALVKEGKTNKEIATKLYISHNTVKKHLQNIYRKYGVKNKIQLVQKL